MEYVVDSEEYEGFLITTYALTEMCDPSEQGFDDETIENINRGNLE
jgi:hypothetical protein